MNLKQGIDDYLKQATLMQVATTNNNQPWACSVYFATDDAMNLYWLSKPDRRHSLELTKNEKVAGTIVLPHTPGDKVRGIQFEGTAKEITDPIQLTKAMELYAKRFGMPPERMNAIISHKDGHSCYRIVPTLYVLFDEINFPDASRQEYIPTATI
jgi:uncharacterized protein YhbP (UPF0306 family)